jgi:uncharacterized protein YceK
MMIRRLVIALTCMALVLGGCATTLRMRDDAASGASASPATLPRSGSDFGSATIPDFGPQDP